MSGCILRLMNLCVCMTSLFFLIFLYNFVLQQEFPSVKPSWWVSPLLREQGLCPEKCLSLCPKEAPGMTSMTTSSMVTLLRSRKCFINFVLKAKWLWATSSHTECVVLVSWGQDHPAICVNYFIPTSTIIESNSEKDNKSLNKVMWVHKKHSRNNCTHTHTTDWLNVCK